MRRARAHWFLPLILEKSKIMTNPSGSCHMITRPKGLTVLEKVSGRKMRRLPSEYIYIAQRTKPASPILFPAVDFVDIPEISKTIFPT